MLYVVYVETCSRISDC